MRKLYAILFSSLFVLTLNAQYSNMGTSTTVTTNVEYQLTKPNVYYVPVTSPTGQAGAVWRNDQINLNNPFTLNVQLFFGVFNESNVDAANPNGSPWNTGADGIAFVLAPAPYIGFLGEDIGYGTTNQTNGSLNPVDAFAAEFDTWQNIANRGFTIKGDPVEDHMAFMKRGNSFHAGTAQGAGNGVPVLLPEIETGTWIPVTISWSLAGGLTVNFNGIIMNATAADVIASLGGNMMVNWGFTGGTARGSNDQRVRFVSNDCSPGRTQTQGGWGNVAHGQNPGSYRDAHFNTAFPSGVTVGVVGGGTLYSATWTTAKAVEDYLPAGGPSGKLTKDWTNPTTTQLKNNAVAQVLALSLSVGFDAADADYSSSGTPLSAMIINSGPFDGWTVGAFLVEANKVLGNDPTATHTVSQVQSTAGAINENYVDGTVDNGYLDCPNGTAQSRTIRDVSLPSVFGEGNISTYPNPSKGQLQVSLGSLKNAEIQVIDSRGAIVERRAGGNAQTLSFNLKKYGTGMYLIKVISGKTVQTSKVLVQN